MRIVLWLITHGMALAIGFGLGVYFLPILTAPPSPDSAELRQMAEGAEYSASFTRDLPGSDFLHWGEGTVSLSAERIVHEGSLAPGPDYKLYLVPEYADDEASFEAQKDRALRLGDVKSFNGFALDVPPGTDLAAYSTVLVWCEAFSEFITSARYR